MAQMPASYLTEKITAIRRQWDKVDTGTGLIELSDHNLRTLADMAMAAQAIIDEINQWTGGTS